MRITVIGATGGTGLHIVEQALGHGQEVTALVRDPSALRIEHERLDVVEGDVLAPAGLDEAMRGTSAVLFVVGAKRGREPTTVYSNGAHHVLEAMRGFAVDRIVAVSAAGVGEPNDTNLPALYRRLVTNATLREVYADMERMEHEIMLSEMGWTIVRPAALTDGPFTGEYRVAEGRSLPEGKRISRADLAAFMLKTVGVDVWNRKGVAIAY